MKDYQTNSSPTKRFNLSFLFNLPDLTSFLGKNKTQTDTTHAQESKQKRAQKSIRERQIGPHRPSCAILLSLSNSSLRQLQGLQH